MKTKPKTFLFLQGPISPFFSETAANLEAKGHNILKINLCFGDALFWHHPGATNYRKSPKEWPSFIRRYFDEHGVTDVVVLGEQRYYHKVMAKEAKTRGIRIIATDFGYIRPDWITLEFDGLSGGSLFPRDPQTIKALAKQCPERDLETRYSNSFVQMAYWDILYHLSSILMWFLFPGYKSHQLHHPVWVYLGTGLRLLKAKRDNRKANKTINTLIKEETPFFFFPLQMATDFSIRSYSDYNSLQDALMEIFQSFAAHSPKDHWLAIKIHPMDPGLENWENFAAKTAKKLNVADRVVFLHGGDLQKILTHTKGTVTVNSTVGMSALSVATPLKLLGQAIYDIEGLVHKGSLDEFWQSPVKPDHDLRDDFMRAVAGTLLIRGAFYDRSGLDVAVSQATYRLDQELINTPVDFTAIND